MWMLGPGKLGAVTDRGSSYTATGLRGGVVATTDKQFFRILDTLADVERADGSTYSSFSVRGKRFGYYWPRTHTVGLKQTLTEQLALVAERPDVFEVQYTSGGFGWVVVYLSGIDADELTELVFEAWRLTAPEDLVAAVPDPAAAPRTARAAGKARRR